MPISNFQPIRLLDSGCWYKFTYLMPTAHNDPASPILRGQPTLLSSPAAPQPFLRCFLRYFNSKYKTLHFGENFMEIRPKFKKKKKKKCYQCLKVYFNCILVCLWGICCGMGWYFVTCLDTKHITWHMVPSFLYDPAKVSYLAPFCPQILAGALNSDTDHLAPTELDLHCLL